MYSTGLYLTLKPLPNGGHSAICLEAVPTEDSILQFSSSEQVDMQTDENRNSPVTIEDMTRVRHVKTNRWLSLTEYTSLIAEGSLTDLEGIQPSYKALLTCSSRRDDFYTLCRAPVYSKE